MCCVCCVCCVVPKLLQESGFLVDPVAVGFPPLCGIVVAHRFCFSCRRKRICDQLPQSGILGMLINSRPLEGLAFHVGKNESPPF